ncbi:ATP-grasp domain-containing protein [Oceanidesulfovibrio indonesiensis]|uniref:ATP-grasp domain-containing protein n=1 Tax=Oceanidesulfovibrio indonesiensis TaxID=54767 RepID=A0A7M3MBP3_9BACT|nr:ATP-grasp domain-containing protein [Oceanidesulfovibrio indonesiensis]TVM15635.1 ATP-grasp domain-containing protein [Oceanidesulfovibrio indonesiensis]
MFILDDPYVSDFLKNTVIERRGLVLDNAKARASLDGCGVDAMRLLDDAAFAAAARQSPRIYANSENAIGWIAANLADTRLPAMIDVFKDKVAFRDLIAPMYPNYFYKGVAFDELEQIDAEELVYPCIVKPAVGFFSLGVHRVESAVGWKQIVAKIRADMERIRRYYPREVLDADRFVIEQCIEGEEFAVDAFYDGEGNVVIVNILGHLFASADDVSDRVYVTSPAIIRRWREPFAAFLAELGERAGLANFPVHVELRVDDAGNIAPIEVNPMRFAGWCVTDLAHHAYGVNPYACYLDGVAPDWDTILPPREGNVYAVVVADIAPDVDCSAILQVDYEGFCGCFSKPLELRVVDYARYGVFAFLFVQDREDDLGELHAILGSDLKEFLNMA